MSRSENNETRHPVNDISSSTDIVQDKKSTLDNQKRPIFDWFDVRNKTLSSTLAYSIAGLGAVVGLAAWNFFSDGGLIRLLGGVSKNEIYSNEQRIWPADNPHIGTLDSLNRQMFVPIGTIISINGPCPSSQAGWTYIGTGRIIFQTPPNPLATSTCPTGSMLSTMQGGQMACISGPAVEGELRREAGYLDGSRGMTIDERFKDDSKYLSGHADGVKEKRYSDVVGPSMLVSVCQRTH